MLAGIALMLGGLAQGADAQSILRTPTEPPDLSAALPSDFCTSAPDDVRATSTICVPAVSGDPQAVEASGLALRSAGAFDALAPADPPATSPAGPIASAGGGSGGGNPGSSAGGGNGGNGNGGTGSGGGGKGGGANAGASTGDGGSHAGASAGGGGAHAGASTGGGGAHAGGSAGGGAGGHGTSAGASTGPGGAHAEASVR